MLEEMQLIMPYLTGEVVALAHLACNGKTCTEIGLFTCVLVLVACMKFNILQNSNKMGKGLDCIGCVVSLDVLET